MPSHSTTAVAPRVREGRIVERRAYEELRAGDQVQHYSTWEQTYGDAIRVEFVKWEHGPISDDHKVVVTWRQIEGEHEGDTYESRERLADKVDVIVGSAELAAIVENPFLALSADQRQLLTCALAGNYPEHLEHLRFDVIKLLARADMGKV